MATSAQTAAPCTAPEARAFDFWLGDWDIAQQIRTADGGFIALPARTSVSLAAGGCALVERWEGMVQFFWEGMQAPEPLSALSVRSYDPASDAWSIYWLDSRDPSFGEPSVGRFENGRGVFFREMDTPNGRRVLRITFSDITEDAVRWELAVLDTTRATWTVLWIMEMIKASNQPQSIDR